MSDEIQNIVSCSRFTVRHAALPWPEFEPHSHNSLVVTAVLSGSLEARIGEVEYAIQQDQVALTNFGQIHSGRGRNLEFLSISLSPSMVDEIVSEAGSIHQGAEISFQTPVVSDEAIGSISRAISTEMASKKAGQAAMLEAMVRQVVVHLLRSHLTVRRSAVIELSRAGPVDRRLRRAIEFMHDNYSRDLALPEIAAAAYLSEYHFARLFKQITGVTPHFYLANLRIERARSLLTGTGHAISEITLMVGYQSQSHFTKVFKSVTGLTPHAYRNGRGASL